MTKKNMPSKSSSSHSPLPAIDLCERISRGDLDFNAPAAQSEHGLPVGNGQMGSMLWTSPSSLKLQVNRVDVYACDSYSHSFFVRHEDYCGGCGFLDVDFVGYGDDVFPPDRVHQHLSVYDALASLAGNGVAIRALAWVSRDVMAIEVTDSRQRPQPISISLRMLRPPTVATWNHKAISVLSTDDNRIVLTQEFTEDSFLCKSVVAVEVVGRSVQTRQPHTEQMEIVCEGGQGTFTILVASNAALGPAKEDVAVAAMESLAQARERGFDGLLEDNRNWWHAFWGKSFIRLHSADGLADAVEAHYTYFLYIMGSSSRGSLPPKFNGMLWNSRGDIRRWGAHHWWHNLSCYYPALMAADHLDLADPMFDMYSNMFDACELAARQQWNSQGIYIPETVAFNGPETLPDTIAEELAALNLLDKPWEQRSQEFLDFARSKHPNLSRWNWMAYAEWKQGSWIWHDRGYGPFGAVTHILSTGAKIAFLYWQRYEITMDADWLRSRAYPMLKGVAEFYRHFPNVRGGADGKSHIYHVNDHEGVWDCTDAIEEMAAMHGIIPLAIRASEILQVDSDLRPLWREFLDNLAPCATTDHPDALNPSSSLPTLDKGLKPARRILGGIGTLVAYATVNYDLATVETQDRHTVELANRTFDLLAQEDNLHPLCHRAIIAALLGRSQDFQRMVVGQLLKYPHYPNRLDTVEGGPGCPGTAAEHLGRAAEALQLALVQAVPAAPGLEPVLNVFPAWPKDWDAQFALRVRGGAFVTSSMRGGRIEFVQIVPACGGCIRVRNPWGDCNVDVTRDGVAAGKQAGSLLELDVTAGECVVLATSPPSP